MGNSLRKYIDIKISEFIFDNKYKRIIVNGCFDRTEGISFKEKNDKLFNFKRPTLVSRGENVYINVYPGMDYVYHYASLIATYLKLMGIEKEIIVNFPKISEIMNTLDNSNLKNIPKKKIAILGYVTGIDFLSKEIEWSGNGDFLWKNIDDNNVLIGCKHSYWGDISGYIVAYLSKIDFEKVIYVGKLGTLNKSYKPNEIIATGNKSIFFDGSIVEWNNLFKNDINDIVKNGVHYTLPSIIQETNDWVKEVIGTIDYVDPEIGHMANSAKLNNIQFSYMHIVSDNLAKKYDEDLSNERKEEIIIKRKVLLNKIGDSIINL